MNQLKMAVAGAQILFVAFGTVVSVPLLMGLDPALVSLGAGLDTLLFQLATRRKVPIFLGSSFTSIAPIIYSIGEWGLPSTMFGLFTTGFMYSVLAALIRWRDLNAVYKLLPPVVVGPVIMVIGLSMATTASSMTMGQSGGKQVIDYIDLLILSGFIFAVTVIISVFGSKMMKLIPILIGVTFGHVLALIMGLVDTGTIINTPWFAVPHFETPQVNWQAASFMLPVAIAPATEHIGGIMAIGNVAGKSCTRDPSLDKTLAGNGLGVYVTGLIGGPPVVTCGEVTSAVMITKSNSPIIMTRAAIFTTCMAFFGKFDVFLASIPIPVMGGIILLLFDTIASLGIKTLIDTKVDLVRSKGLVIVSPVLTTGIGGMIIKVGTLSFAGIGLCAVLTIILNYVLPNTESGKA